MRTFALLLSAFALSFASVACSGADPDSVIDDPGTVQSQLVDEGHECSVLQKCKPGLVCVARVKGADVTIKGEPCVDCGQTSSSSSSSGWSSSSSSGASGSSGWSSSSSSGASGSSGWSSSSSSSSGASGSSGWSGSSSSSSGATPEVGVCISLH